MQTRSYRRLREEDRHIIYRMRKAGNKQSEIAHALGFSQSAISKQAFSLARFLQRSEWLKIRALSGLTH